MTATNTLLTNSVITNEALRVLRNQFVLVPRSAQTVDDLFGQVGYKNGSTINIRIPVRFTSATGAAINTNNSIETQTSLTLIQRNIGMNYSTKDLTLSIDLFKDRFIKPAMAQLASDIDADGFALYYKAQSLATPGAYVVAAGGPSPAPFTGADVATLRPFLDAQARLDEQATPRDNERYVAINPSCQAAVVDGLKGLFQSATEIAEQYKRGLMGLAAGLEWVMSQVLPSFTSGTRLATIGATTVASGPTVGAVIPLAQGSVTTTITQGDQFTIANVYAINPLTRASTGKLQVFTVQALATFVAGAVSVTVTPAINITAPNQTTDSAAQNGAVVTWMSAASTTTPVNLVWHKEAFMVAFCDLETDLPGAESYIARDPESKISLRFTRQYDSQTDTVYSRIDALYGWTLVRPVMAAVVLG